MHTQFRRMIMLLAAVVLAALPAAAQTVHQVAAGTDVLKAAIDAAAPGDIIELTTSGGAYLSTDQIVLDKDLTIRGAEGLEKKPVLKYIGTSTGAYMFKIVSSPRVVFQNLEFDGDGTAEGAAAKAKYALRLDNGDTLGTMVVKVLDCTLHDFNEKIIKPYPNCGIDSLIVHNSVFYHGAKEGVTLYSGSSSDPAVRMKYAEFTNCTFYGFAREGIKGDTNPDTKVRINHSTFYDCGGSSKALIYFDDMTDVEVKNSLFVHNSYSSYFARFESADNRFHHNGVWDVASWKVSSATVSDTVQADPKFADPANGDFTLSLDSPMLGKADDGHALGDLRWDPTYKMPKVIKVEEGDGTLLAAVEQAADGDTIELVTNGGLYTTSSTDKIVIDKHLVIRARKWLTQKPVVRNTKADASSARLFEIRAGGDLTLIGLDLDGRMEDGGAAHAKNIIRTPYGLTEADSFHTNLRIYDCVLHYSKEGLVKGYSKVYIDTLVVKNSILTHAGKEGIIMRESSSAGGPVLQYVDIENCTFAHIGREAFNLEFSDPVIRINHCTFDSVSEAGSYRILYPKNVTDVEVKNSIFTNQLGSKGESVTLYGNSVIAYCDTFNVAKIKLNGSATKGAGMMGVDPKYTDPAHGDYTLAADSPVRGKADDGLAMGDLRWAIAPNKMVLTIQTEGKGVVQVNPPGYVYDPGTVVTLTAVPDPGWELEKWVGNVEPGFPPNANPVTVTMNQNETVVAKFRSTAPQVKLNIQVLGLGHVEVKPEPSEAGTYDQGTVVTLTAVPDTNTWVFKEWQGDISDTVNPVTFAVDSNMTVTAAFASIFPQFTLTTQVVGMGQITVDPKPILGTYDSLQTVVVTAQPALGWQFAGWSGDLTGTANPDTVVMDTNKTVIATFTEINLGTHTLAIDTTWDLYDAVMFANNNSTIDTIMLATGGGVYTSHHTEDVAVLKPLVIVAKPGLEKMPVVTNSDPEKKNLDIFRVFNDFTLIGVELDGSNPVSHGMKYGIRLRSYAGGDSVKPGTNITVRDCYFHDFFQNKDPKADGHAFKIDVGVRAGKVLFENCTFENFGYEAIRISDTEKWNTDRALDTLIVRNCTFINIDAEGIRYYSDANPATPDPPVLIEHVTFYHSATRVLYLKNSSGAIVRDLIIANSRLSGHGRDNDLMDAQGAGTVVAFVDTFHVKAVPIKSSKGGTVDTATVWGYDPMFVDPEHGDLTLAEGSPLYGLAHDGKALGDLRWAKHPPSTGVEEAQQIPKQYFLAQNYPNPFNPTTSIQFGLVKPGKTTIKIYNVLGTEVMTLLDRKLEAGVHTVTFDASRLASGIYFYRIQSGSFRAVKKMILMK